MCGRGGENLTDFSMFLAAVSWFLNFSNGNISTLEESRVANRYNV